jgi:ligand-binding sensor domain-containing protein
MRGQRKTLVILVAACLAAGPVVAAPARAADDPAAGLLLQPEAAVAAACHAAPSEVRGRVSRAGWTLAATDAGVLVTAPGGAPRLLTTCDGLPSNRVTGVAPAPEGAWLVGSLGGGVVRLTLAEDGALRAVAPLPGLPVTRVTAVAARGGEVWVGTAEEGLWRWQDGVATRPVRALRSDLVSALAAPEGGPLYVGRGRRGLYVVDPARARARRLLADHYVRALTLVDGVVHVDTPQAACDLRVGARAPRCGPPPADAPLPAVAGAGPAPHVTALAVHQERLWVGTFAHGLWTFDGARWAPVDSAAAPGVLGYVNDLAVADGVLWLASPNGAARHDAAGWRVLGAADGLPPGHVNAVLPAGDAVWLATSRGVLRLDARGPVLFGTAEGLPGGLVYDLALDAEGRVLVGTNHGAARWTGRRFEAWTHEGGELSDNWVNAVVAWEDALWVGTYDAGVDVRDPAGRWAPAQDDRALWVNPGGLFPLDGVLAVAALGDGLWARDRGGAWVEWTVARLVPDPDVTAVASFGGRLWVGTRAGLASWSPAAPTPLASAAP